MPCNTEPVRMVYLMKKNITPITTSQFLFLSVSFCASISFTGCAEKPLNAPAAPVAAPMKTTDTQGHAGAVMNRPEEREGR